ncbi:MAG: TIGR04283 family arsenosugar biosynthesis glycosyltransferase [Caldimonas sp.]
MTLQPGAILPVDRPTLRLSIVVPALDEAEGIAAALDALAAPRALGHEVIVVDGGSGDATLSLSRARADVAIAGPRGRARQMNAGAAVARGDVLLFLHADTRLPRLGTERIAAAVAKGAAWGRFDVRVEGRSPMLIVVAALMNARSRWTGIATGDQAMFVRRDLFERVGGFPDQPLMEDVELSSRLRACAPPACLRERVVTSGRRWESRGVWPTIVLMWRLRWCYWRGAPADELARAWR